MNTARPGKIPTLVDAPHAGHTAVIADYHKGQSLIETLLTNGIEHVALTDWKSATDDMKDLEIDNYLAEIVVAIDDLGGRVNLVGLCQGGWVSAMVAARFPEKVNSLVLAGAPIDTDAGNGPIKRMVHASPLSFYEELVALGGGSMKGKFMLQGWKNMHPEQHYIRDHIDLYEHIDDPAYIAKKRLSRAGMKTLLTCRAVGIFRSSSSSSRRTASPRVNLSGSAGNSASATSFVQFTSWQAPRMTSRRPNRCWMRQTISARQENASSGRPSPEVTSASSWVRERCTIIGRQSRPGSALSRRHRAARLN